MSKNRMVGSASEQSGVLGVVKEIVRQFCDGELTKEQGQLIIERKNPFGNQPVKSKGDSLRIVVDYSQSLSAMIAAGKYDWVDDNITDEHSPINSKGEVELNSEPVHYGKRMGSDDVVRDLESRGLRPATLPELLAFGASYPDKQREFPIVALGSVWPNFFSSPRDVACLDSPDFARVLRLDNAEGVWDGDYRFLAFRK